MAKTDAKNVETKEEETIVVESESKEVNGRKSYHISKREEDGKWQVKLAKGQRAIKLFKTKEEAVEYTKTLAKNQEGYILIHPSKGKNKGRFSSK